MCWDAHCLSWWWYWSKRSFDNEKKPSNLFTDALVLDRVVAVLLVAIAVCVSGAEGDAVGAAGKVCVGVAAAAAARVPPRAAAAARAPAAWNKEDKLPPRAAVAARAPAASTASPSSAPVAVGDLVELGVDDLVGLLQD